MWFKHTDEWNSSKRSKFMAAALVAREMETFLSSWTSIERFRCSFSRGQDVFQYCILMLLGVSEGNRRMTSCRLNKAKPVAQNLDCKFFWNRSCIQEFHNSYNKARMPFFESNDCVSIRFVTHERRLCSFRPQKSNVECMAEASG